MILLASGGVIGPAASPAVGAFRTRFELAVKNNRQNDPKWAKALITPSGRTIGECGCWLSVLSTIFTIQTGFPAGASIPHYPVNIGGAVDFSFSPPYLDKWAAEHGGYTGRTEPGSCGTSIKPDTFANAAVSSQLDGKPLGPVGFTWRSLAAPSGIGADPGVLAEIDSSLLSRRPVAVRIEDKPATPDGPIPSHMLIIVGFDPQFGRHGEYLVVDPQSEGVFPAGEWDDFLYRVREVRFVTPVYKQQTWFGLFDDPEPIELVVTDPLGRRTGVDPTSNAGFNEQPQGSYERSNGWQGPLGLAPPEDAAKRYWTSDPVDGVYAVEVIGTGRGSWTLDVWNGGNTITQTLSGTTSLGEIDRYEITLRGGRVTEVVPVDEFVVHANAGLDQATYPGVDVTVDGYRSWAPFPATITTYSWDFGDGIVRSGRRATHAFASPGLHSVQLTVTDDLGRTATDTVTINVVSPPSSDRVTSMVTTSPVAPGVDAPGGTGFGQVVVTPDGRYAAMLVTSLLVTGAQLGKTLYRKDLTTGEVVRVAGPDARVTAVADISADGDLITFTADTDLVVEDTHPLNDLYLANVATGAFELAARTDDEVLFPGASGGTMSSDGRFLVFTAVVRELSYDGILVVGSRQDVYLRDRVLGTTRRISETLAGEASTSQSYAGAVSDDGSKVVYATFAGNIVDGFRQGMPYPSVVVRDLVAGTQRVVDLGGVSSNRYGVDMSADGRYIAFLSNGQAALPVDQQTTAVVPEPYLIDTLTGQLRHLAPPIDGVRPIVPGTFTAGSYLLDISDNGAWVAFHHRAQNIVPRDVNGLPDVFLYNTTSGLTTIESVRTDGGQSGGSMQFINGSERTPEIAVDNSGGMLFFSDASDLTPEISNTSFWNLYRRGQPPGGTNGAPVATLNGPYVGFASATDRPAAVVLDAARSIDPESDPLTATIDPGDGSGPTAAGGLALTHSYTGVGTYDATAMVTDGEGRSSSVTSEVEVLPAPPDDTLYVSECTEPGGEIKVGGVARTANAALLATGWDTSRGPVPLASVELAASWTASISAQSTLPALGFASTMTAPSSSGEYTVSLVGTSATATFAVPCPNPPARPTADAGGPYRIEVGSPLRLDGSRSVGARSFAWEFGDGTSGTGVEPEHVYTTPGRYIVQLVVGDQAAAIELTAAAVPEGVFGRPSDASVFAVASRAIVDVFQVPPPTTTTTPSTTTPSTTTTAVVPTEPVDAQPTTTLAPPSPPVPTTAQRPSIVSLPRTGSSVATSVRAAVMIFGLGAAALVVARRPRGRRRTRPDDRPAPVVSARREP